MIKKPNITSTQLILLFAGSSVMFPYTFLPVINSAPRNQDCWIVAILSVIYTIVFSSPLLLLLKKFEGKTLNEISDKIMGKIFGRICCVIFSMFFLFCYCACLMMIILFIKMYLFPQTPTAALLLYSIAPVAYLSYKGANSIGRMSTFVVPFIIMLVISFFVLGLYQFDFNILRPVLSDSSLWDINKGALLTGARVSEIFIVVVFSHLLDKKTSMTKLFLKSLGVYLGLLLLILFPTILVLGLDSARHSWDPYFFYIRMIRFYDFIQRIESINTLAWLMGSFLKLSIYNYMASSLLSGVFNTKTHKKIALYLSVLVFIVGVIPSLLRSSLIEMLRSDMIFPWVVFPVVFVLPFIMVITYYIKKVVIKLKSQSQ